MRIEGFLGDSVFGIVQVDPDGLDAEAFASGRILSKEISKMEPLDLFEVIFKGHPTGSFGQ
jgi:hypothetical protein